MTSMKCNLSSFTIPKDWKLSAVDDPIRKMASEIETSGIIANTSKSSCVVSVSIDGCTKLFSVSKTIFYLFGVKCEGDLTNLVEEYTEVELSYRVRPGNAPTIVAVWLGEKPDLSGDGERRVPVYDGKGVLNDFKIDTDFGRVYVDRSVTFRNGQRETGTVLNEEVTFDAVPISARTTNFSGPFYDFSGDFYEATCVWIGSKPRLVDRFVLDIDEVMRDGIRDETGDVEFDDDVCGTVVVIPSDVVAFVDVEVGPVVVKVMLFRSSFRRVCDRIQDSVDVGDELCMRLRYAFVFPGRRHWFAVSARKSSCEVQEDEICDSGDAVGTDDAKSDSIVEANDVLKTDGVPKTEDFLTAFGILTSLTAGECGRSASHAKTGEVADESSKDTTEMRSVDSDGSFVKAADQFDKDSEILFCRDPPLEGVLSYLDPNGCITFGRLKIFVEPSNFHIGGKPCTVDDFARVAKGCIIANFEAVLMRRKDEKFSEFSHEATCVWIDQKPLLAAIASSLPPPNFQLLQEPDKKFYGKVTKICLPSVALTVLPDESTATVHVNSFVTKSQYPTKGVCPTVISSYVRLDDWVHFKVRKFSNFVTAFDTGPVFPPELWAKMSPLIAVLRHPSTPDILRSHSPSLTNKPPSCSKAKHPNSSPETGVCIASAFKTGQIAQDRTYLINRQGTIKSRYDVLLKKNLVTVQHAFGSTMVNDKTVYVSDGKILCLDSIATRSGRLIHFDAQARMSPKSNAGFVVTRMWDGGDRPASEVVLFSDLKLFEGVATRCCPAKITSIPLHDTAIASVKGVPILVPFASLVTLQEVNMACSAIDTLLSVGDFVGLEFEKHKFSGEMSGSYYRAVRCWSLSKGGEKITSDDEMRIAKPRLRSWFSLWGFGQFFCKGNVHNIFGRYYVGYSSKGSCLREMDIFEKGKVFVNGELVVREKFDVTNNTKITFHVGHTYVKKISDDLSRKMFEPDELFPVYSWTGSEQSPEYCMRDILAVTKGLVCSNRFYEVVVDSFPTPTHAICRLGCLPVLVPLPQITQNDTFVGVTDVNLRKGDRIIVNVLERVVQDKTVLLSNTPNYKRVKDHVYQDVLKNVYGEITLLPNPTGLIEAFNSDIVVSFELCNVRSNEKSQNSKSGKSCLDSSSKKLSVGRKIYFSAIKADTKTAPYKAFEVFDLRC